MDQNTDYHTTNHTTDRQVRVLIFWIGQVQLNDILVQLKSYGCNFAWRFDTENILHLHIKLNEINHVFELFRNDILSKYNSRIFLVEKPTYID